MRTGQTDENRKMLARRNALTTVANQIVTVVCGILVPRMLIGAFGSVLYGAAASISQFLSYISLMESGIGRAARSALFRPLADGDRSGVSRIYQAMRLFFRGIAVVFVFYTIILAYFYYDIAKEKTLSREYLFFLVIAISLSTVVDYLCGVSNQTLLHADQRKYITNITVSIVRILNTLLVLILIRLGSGLILIKLCSSLLIIIRPLFLSLYVRRHYRLDKVPRGEACLPQKWSGMAQHAAYFIHTNTDVILLTVFAGLRYVAVYAVYSLVVTSLRNLIYSMMGGMEAELGNIYARGETEILHSRYRRYQAIAGLASAAIFGAAAFLIVPFVTLYTKGITDADYIQPVFALIMALGETANCLALPCSTLPIAGNQLRKSQWGSFGEAIVNIGLSLLLVRRSPLIGVAAGTLAAEIFKLAYYSSYASRHIIHDSLPRTLARHFGVLSGVAAFGLAAVFLNLTQRIAGFGAWIVYAVGITAISVCMALIIGSLCYRREMTAWLKRLKEAGRSPDR